MKEKVYVIRRHYNFHWITLYVPDDPTLVSVRLHLIAIELALSILVGNGTTNEG